MSDKLKILFMGTPDFAAVSLRALLDCGYTVIGAVTQPDKPKGRGYAVSMSSVKTTALERGITVHQPNTLRSDEFAALLSEINPNLIIVTAYGKIIPPNILDYPEYGCINVHGSLLPEYRGAAPIQRAIIDGKKTTGITTIQMDSGIDTGDMLLHTETPIKDDDNFETLHDRLAAIGASLLIETLHHLENGTLIRTKQPDSGIIYASKIEKADCCLDFSCSSRSLFDRIRGLSPFPLAFTHTPDGKLLKIVSSEIEPNADGEKTPLGTVISIDNGKIIISCGDGFIAVTSVIPEGKGKMSAKDFINGRKIFVGDILS